MKRLGLFLFLLALAWPVAAQQQTLIGNDRDLDWGGFGGPVLKLTAFDGTTALLVGGRGAVLLVVDGRHGFALGGGGYGLTTEVRAGDLIDEDGDPLYLEMGYGGVELEYINRPDRLVHLSASALIGAGGATYSDRRWHEDDFEHHDDGDPFFVFEPGVQVMLNVTNFFRIGAGASYRYVQGVDLEAFGDSDLRGAAGSLTLKFGGF